MNLNPINIKQSLVYRQLSSVRSGIELDYLLAKAVENPPFALVSDPMNTPLRELFIWEETSEGYFFWASLDKEIVDGGVL